MKDYYVYLHRRATDGKVFYVGKGHGRRAFDKNNGRSKWWKSIVKKYGYNVEIYLNGLQEWYAIELEKELIAYYGRENICNMTDGGEGMSGWTPSEETIKKRTSKTIGQKRTEETKKRMSEAKKGYKPSKETLIKMSQCRIGFKHTEEAKKKVSIAVRNRKVSEETRKKMSEARKGYKQTEIAKEKMSSAKSVPVVCSNGMIFKSATSAAAWLRNNGWPKASPSGVSAARRGVVRTAYGYTWKYVDEK